MEYLAKATSKIVSLEQKPVKKGKPTRANEPINIIVYENGNKFFKPPNFLISCSSETAWITEPAPKKSKALKNA